MDGPQPGPQGSTPTPRVITIIEARRRWQPFSVAELRRYGDLLYFLVARDIQVLYKQTVLGFSWALIRPLFAMLVYTAVFGMLIGIKSDGVPYTLFAFTALVPWTYFSGALTKSAESLIGASHLITKVYFPRVYIPLTPVIAGLLDFAIALVAVLLMMLFYGVTPGRGLVYLPGLILLMFFAALSAGLWLSALAVQYRDVRHAVAFFSQLLMFAAPVVWPASLIPEHYRLLYGLYPMAGIIEGFRSALLGTRPMPWDLLAMGTLTTVTSLVGGAIYFRMREGRFADVV